MVTRSKVKASRSMESQEIVTRTRRRLRKRRYVESHLELERPKKRTRTRLSDKQQTDEDRESSDSDPILSDRCSEEGGMQYTLDDIATDDVARDGITTLDDIATDDIARDGITTTHAINEEAFHDKQTDHGIDKERGEIASDSTSNGLEDETRQRDHTLDMDRTWSESENNEFAENIVDKAVELRHEEVVSADTTALATLFKSLPGRITEIQLLLSLFGEVSLNNRE